MNYPWHNAVWTRFQQQIDKDKLPHGILLSGVMGLGKNALAQDMVAARLCNNLTEGLACGHCHSCNLLEAGTHPDHQWIAPEKDSNVIKVAQIRALKEKQSLTAHTGTWKTIVISPANTLNINAYNSLLKMLEEPQDNTLIILVTAHPEQLPITVRSRCQQWHVETPTKEDALSWLAKESPDTSSEHAALLAVSLGAPLTVLALSAVNWLQEMDLIKRQFHQLLLGRGDVSAMSTAWQQYDLKRVFKQLQYWTNHLLKTAINTTEDSPENRFSTSFCWQVSDCILQTIRLLSSPTNLNTRLLIEDFMVSLKQHAIIQNKEAQYG